MPDLSRTQRLRLLHSRDYLRYCVTQGMSCREIADNLGVHRKTVREWMRYRSVQPTKRPTTRGTEA